MSWGERSCLKPCRCPDECKYATCNVDCKCYVWDGETVPDSEKLAEVIPLRKRNSHFDIAFKVAAKILEKK